MGEIPTQQGLHCLFINGKFKNSNTKKPSPKKEGFLFSKLTIRAYMDKLLTFNQRIKGSNPLGGTCILSSIGRVPDS